MTASREQLVMDTFVELADMLASDTDIGDFLQGLVEHCAQILRVDTGGVVLEGADGKLQLVAATSERMKELEDLEIQEREGPCLDAYRQARQVLAEDLRQRIDIWPKAATKALDMGLLAVYAFPLRWRGDCIGALNLYRDSAGGFYPDDVRVAQAFADVAALAILQERRVHDARTRNAQLQRALDSRMLIERAKGVFAERHGIAFQQAFEAIRGYARSHNRTLRSVCQEIVDGGDPIGSDPGTSPRS